jgi:hypothetical protein
MMSLPHIVVLLPYLATLFLFIHIFTCYWRLRRIPGPYLASISDLWRLLAVYRRRPQEIQLQLHRKYGDVVRLGPNCVSVSGPDMVSSIYGIGKGLCKVSYKLLVHLLALLMT